MDKLTASAVFCKTKQFVSKMVDIKQTFNFAKTTSEWQFECKSDWTPDSMTKFV